MHIWLLLCFAMLLVPTLLLVFGAILSRRPPKEANWSFGYRSPRSMASDEAWDFAQKLAGFLWFWTGAITFLSVLIVCLVMRIRSLSYMSSACLICMLAELFLLAVSYIVIEIILHRQFDKYGDRR